MGYSMLSTLIPAIIVAILAQRYSFWLKRKKEKENLLEALLNEINYNLVHAGNIIEMMSKSDGFFRFPALKNSAWLIGTGNALNPNEMQKTDGAYYKLEYINELIKSRELYNLFCLADKIPKQNLSDIENAITQEINNEKDGILVLFQNAKKEVESIKKSLSNSKMWKFLLSLGLMVIFFLWVALYLEISLEFLVISVPLLIASGFTFYYFYSLIMLEGLPKKLFDCNNIRGIRDPENLERSKDIAKFNIQNLHSFIVMTIAVVALCLSLYGLYTGFIFTKLGVTIGLRLIFSLTPLAIGLIASIFAMNWKWYRIYNKLMDIKLEQTQ